MGTHTGSTPVGFTRPWGFIALVVGHMWVVRYAVGFARPDRWSRSGPADASHPWHAVKAQRPPSELDGEIELAVCGVLVQVWGSQRWERIAAGRTACPDCLRIAPVQRPLSVAVT